MALTRTVQSTERVGVAIPPPAAFDAVCQALSQVGRVKQADRHFGRVVGRIFAGGMNMNRADVTVLIESNAGTGSSLTVTATVQEGLISQNTGPGAISRLLGALGPIAPTTSGSSTPGWYPDPLGQPRLRWHDGHQWTDHTTAPPPAPLS